MTRPTYALIDRDAFVTNYRTARAMAPGRRAFAVVKADGYGHGAVPLGQALDAEADGFAVACCEEALELRESGIRSPILLLEGVFEPDELVTAAEHGFDIVVHQDRQLDWLTHARLSRPLRVFLKIDTGMHRLGFTPERLVDCRRRLSETANVGDLVVMTHFARADEPDRPATRQQIERLRSVLGNDPLPLCLANSAAIQAWPAAHGDWIRPGIMLYGSSPIDDQRMQAALRPVMRFEAGLIATHRLAAGEAVGYGARFVCDRPMRIGVVAAGYADGYPRHAPDGTPVSVGGHPARLAGRVSMDMLTIDLTDLPEIPLGTRVELWGERVLANTVAQHCDTIAYELFTRITRRVHRTWL
jgi:alanine racemase